MTDNRRALSYGQDVQAPSNVTKSFATYIREQQWYPIFNGQPFSRLGLPISVFHPIFAHLQDDLDHLQTRPVDPSALANIARLFYVMQQGHESEKHLREFTLPIICKLLKLQVDKVEMEYSKYDGQPQAESDGAVLVALLPNNLPVPQRAIAVHFEWKLQLMEADIQSLCTFRKHVAHIDKVCLLPVLFDPRVQHSH